MERECERHGDRDRKKNVRKTRERDIYRERVRKSGMEGKRVCE